MIILAFSLAGVATGILKAALGVSADTGHAAATPLLIAFQLVTLGSRACQGASH